MSRVLIKRSDDAGDLPLPTRMSPQAAGMDLYANIHGDVVVPRGGRSLVPTGIMMAMPEGYEAQIRPRSGLAWRHGISIPNSPATIDADYRGEIQVILMNHGEEDFIIRRGDRIAQMVISRVETMLFEPVDELPPSERGEGGFGHTGV